MRTLLRVLLLWLVAASGAAPAFAQFSETVPVTVQTFERGQMLWRSDTGTIWALVRGGRLLTFPGEVTETPEQPLISSASPVIPLASVFDPVYTASTLPELIGAPVDVETSFDALFGYANNTISVTLLDGSVLLLGPGSTWTRAVEATPEPLVPALLSFGTSPEAVEAGASLAVDWAAEGVTTVELEVLAAHGGSPLVTLADLPPIGTASLEIPAAAAGELALVIYGEAGDAGERTTLGSVDLSVRPLPDGTVTASATYQPFEGGFMLWRDDVMTVYAFFSTSADYVAFDNARIQTMIDNPLGEARAGYLLPSGIFGRVWGSDEAVRTGLGYALAPVQPYTLTMALYDGVPLAFTLPDGAEVTLAEGNTWQLAE